MATTMTTTNIITTMTTITTTIMTRWVEGAHDQACTFWGEL